MTFIAKNVFHVSHDILLRQVAILLNKFRHLLRLQLLFVWIIVKESLEQREELSVDFGFHRASDGFYLRIKERSRAYFPLKNGHILLILLFILFNFFFNELRAVGHILANEVLDQVWDEHGHHVPKLNFVEFIN